MERPKRLSIAVFACAVLCLSPYGPLPHGIVCAKDGKEVISVEKDKDKTSYVIRSNNDNTEKDEKDKAWEMLDHVIIDTRGHHGEGPDNHR